MARPSSINSPQRMDMRLPALLVERVDKWRGALPRVPSRCEAIRRLIDKGLEAVEADERTEGGAQG